MVGDDHDHGAIQEVACGDILAPLDKQHRLAASCAPGDLVNVASQYNYGGGQLMRSAAAAAFNELAAAAAAAGQPVSLVANSRRRGPIGTG